MQAMYKLSAALVVAGLAALLAACGDDDNGGGKATPTSTATAAPTATPTPVPCDLPPPFCGGDFPLNTAMTTAYGPAWADVTLEATNFMPCFGPYALCFYANCDVSADGKVSSCPCYESFGPSFVLINGILNADLYEQTVAQCGADGAGCQAINSSPACTAINRGDFYGDAARVSTFSFYLATEEHIGITNCTDPGLYAGCMTAPCDGPTMTNPDGTVSITCDCPNHTGPYQLGTFDQKCDDSPRAWSAAYNPSVTLPDPCDMVAGGCVVDAQGQCGCPLYGPSTELPPDSGVDCNVVCAEYNGCLKTGTEIQLGYTCDATLCTSTDQPLIADACNGLQNCELGEVFKAERAADCSCCASQLCNCDANGATQNKIFELNAAQRAQDETPQCDINGTLCGEAP
ncbi:MAG: hypothetical protein SF182_11815 [Deltaproteobacteria bacterium]|nr:hypothetical protein [Deltaproteobacteria bacterium]